MSFLTYINGKSGKLCIDDQCVYPEGNATGHGFLVWRCVAWCEHAHGGSERDGRFLHPEAQNREAAKLSVVVSTGCIGAPASSRIQPDRTTGCAFGDRDDDRAIAAGHVATTGKRKQDCVRIQRTTDGTGIIYVRQRKR